MTKHKIKKVLQSFESFSKAIPELLNYTVPFYPRYSNYFTLEKVFLKESISDFITEISTKNFICFTQIKFIK